MSYASAHGAAVSADLGGSSKYSSETPRRLKWRRVPCEQQLHMGQSILSCRLTPLEGCYQTDSQVAKGNRINICEPGHGACPTCRAVCGNANELGDTGEGPGKSSLFFLRVELPGIGLSGDRDVVPEKLHGSCAVRCALVCP